ncbi:nucleotide exchange factor GrpE [Marinobacterium arenosum]|uniref:nucleotide exchange factor GrpE n=1 Tax=Marinobacterium arenosum TaxID=2862496 RepID=UPI001C959BCC|nr:nucleotide exchange factor GrpE [Marinobacterium arenosum]MBY4677368.1 nucleotide exchange factor GrpE [Marinobacterium arenosum]
MASEQKSQTEQPETPVNDLQAEATEQAAASEQPTAENAAGAESAEAGQLLPENEAAELLAQLAAAEQEIASLREQALRAQADVQNIRRRAEQDVEKAHKFGLEKFAGELLPVVDNLERALEACNADEEAVKALVEGVEMTLNMFVGGLEKFQIEQINPLGETFDPSLHQAMSMVDAGDAKPNTVVAVMQKGYTLHGRLIRPAMVMVAKG